MEDSCQIKCHRNIYTRSLPRPPAAGLGTVLTPCRPLSQTFSLTSPTVAPRSGLGLPSGPSFPCLGSPRGDLPGGGGEHTRCRGPLSRLPGDQRALRAAGGAAAALSAVGVCNMKPPVVSEAALRVGPASGRASRRPLRAHKHTSAYLRAHTSVQTHAQGHTNVCTVRCTHAHTSASQGTQHNADSRTSTQ